MLWLRVAAILSLIVFNTLAHALPLLALALIKVAMPVVRWRRAFDPPIVGLAENWIAVNSAMIDRFTRTRFEVDSVAGLQPRGHYLVLANHQSWVDILVLQKVFNRRIPFLRFFLKRQLFWVPVLGLCWWALDFPFMGRYSRQQIAKRPELADRDIDSVRRACARFRTIPVSVMNFVEGTRYTQAKYAAQASPYRHLLKPKSGGVAFTIEAMGDSLRALLDVTIVYPAGRPSIIDLIAGRIPEIRVSVLQREIPDALIGGDYRKDPEHRARVQDWLNALWVEKDASIARMLATPPRP